ncbi:MAG: TIGR02186 family protein [Rhodospirillaceae bacterium]|nr:TIGR02186 family protein [Rhodospirillaceae bacterium]
MIAVLGSEARAQGSVPLVADLSSHLVAITTGFSGTDVLLFGATDGPGDIAVVVRGPAENEVIRRKGRKGPMWVNTDEVTFRDAPSYYRVASSRPLDEFAPQTLLSRYQIGIDNLRIGTLADTALKPEEVADFRKAFVRLKTEASLYDQGLGAVNFMSNRLFRTELHFPSNVPTGTYLVEVYLFRDGDVTSAEIVPLNISQIGMSADIFDFAHNLAPLYGIVSILLAASAGWMANVAFRRT